MEELRKNLVINGVRYDLAVGQAGDGSPNEDTPGKVGVTYLDKAAKPPALYVCISAEKSDDQIKCSWARVGGSDAAVKAEPEYHIKGKSVVFFGDSICYGAADTGGYAKQIQEITGCVATNLGRSGATIANAGSSTYKIVQMVREFSRTADLIVIEGGTNDCNQGVQLGEITAGYDDALDETTICGALESIVRMLLD